MSATRLYSAPNPLKKENVGKYHNYGIKDCIATIAATNQKWWQTIVFNGLIWSIRVAFTSQIALNRTSHHQQYRVHHYREECVRVMDDVTQSHN